ncbi:MAG: urease accessory protein UreD [Hyphomicrobiaceae bacterium]
MDRARAGIRGGAAASAAASALAGVRVVGGVAATFATANGATRPRSVRERDGYRMRFPRDGSGLQGVVINTGGGVAGGDAVAIALEAQANADVLVTTQSAERVYRALDGADTEINLDLVAADGARLVWIPHETILFDRSHVTRRLEANVASSARLLIVETLVFGRKAHGETVASGHVADRWRIRREGRLIFADTLRLTGDVASILASPMIADGAHAVSTVVYVAPDAEERLDAVRAQIARSKCRLAASAFDGLVIIRAVANEMSALRRALTALVPLLSGRDAPRQWHA